MIERTPEPAGADLPDGEPRGPRPRARWRHGVTAATLPATATDDRDEETA